jgi:hypothetical protein
MPYGIRPSNVRVCHFTTRANWGEPKNLPAADVLARLKFFAEIPWCAAGGERLKSARRA